MEGRADTYLGWSVVGTPEKRPYGPTKHAKQAMRPKVIASRLAAAGLPLPAPLPRLRKMLALYHDLPFVLIGDSGQHDPEVYHRIVAENPNGVSQSTYATFRALRIG